MSEVDRLRVELSGPVLQVRVQRADELAAHDEWDRENLDQPLRLDQLLVAEALAGQIEDGVVVGAAKRAPRLVERNSLGPRVVVGETLVAPDDQSWTVGILEHHGGCVGSQDVLQRPHDLRLNALKIEAAEEFDTRAV